MGKLFYSWRNKTEPSIADYKVKKFTYKYNGASSETAFWVFTSESGYKPDKNIVKNRLLIVFDFDTMGDTVILNPDNHIDFESETFKGEAKHQELVIVKSNEAGAYGIGARIRPFLTIKDIRLGTVEEIRKSLGMSKVEPVTAQTWP